MVGFNGPQQWLRVWFYRAVYINVYYNFFSISDTKLKYYTCGFKICGSWQNNVFAFD